MTVKPHIIEIRTLNLFLLKKQNIFHGIIHHTF